MRPNSVSGLLHDQWVNSGGSDKADSTSDQSDSTYIEENTLNQKQTLQFENMPAAAQEPSGSMTYGYRHVVASGTSGTVADFADDGTNEDQGADTGSSGGYATTTRMAANDPSAASWTLSTINALQYGGIKSNSGDKVFRISDLYLQINYVAKPGGFFWNVACFLSPFLAVASHGFTRGELARMLMLAGSDLPRRTAWERFRPCNEGEWEEVRGVFARRPSVYHLGEAA